MNNRNLYLLRGIPASGKSTWIKENNLEKYCLSSDKIRLLFPQFGDSITQIYDNQVWNLLYDLMEKRMQLGLPIIIDATHYRKSFITAYEPYCEKYGYHIIVVDFTNTELLTCFERNSFRTFDRVPEQVITKMFETIKQNNNEIKKDFRVISPEEAANLLNSKKYIQKQPYKPKEFYDIFLNLYNSFRDEQKLDELIDSLRPEVLKCFPILQILDIDHNNKWHYRTILDHSIEVLCRFKKEATKYNFEMSYIDIIICLFHDIGKPFTMTSNKTDNYTHYYNHPLTGAQFFNEYCRKYFIDEITNRVELDNIYFAIKTHDNEINDNEDNKHILLLHLADAKSHVLPLSEKDNRIQLRIDKARKLLLK